MWNVKSPLFVGEKRRARARASWTVLPVWKPHQTKIAVNETAYYCKVRGGVSWEALRGETYIAV